MISDYQSVLKLLIIRDKTWIYAYVPETNDQSSEYRTESQDHENRPKSLKNQSDVTSSRRLLWCCTL